MNSLWDEMLDIPSVDDKSIVQKVNNPKQKKSVKATSNKLPLSDQLKRIEEEVYRILGDFASNTLCIRDEETFNKYIDHCITNHLVGIDTETNNSLVPHTCKLMGLCLYTYNDKQVYVPVNHVTLESYILNKDDPSKWELLPNQLTEQQIAKGLKRLIDAEVLHMTANGKFDYEVIHCTCNTDIRIDWDTQIAARILNENELAGLKPQYVAKIDPSSEKYDIEKLFEKLPYAIFPPELFALYAATDAYKTVVLADWQKEQFKKRENAKLFELYQKIELPLPVIVAKMELAGVSIDSTFAQRLSEKYHKKITIVDKSIEDELHKYDSVIEKWKATPEANIRFVKDTWLTKMQKDNPNILREITPFVTPITVLGDTGEKLTQYQLKQDTLVGLPYKIADMCSKSKADKLADPINLASPEQLAIFLYDVLGVDVIDKKSPRGTGEEILKELAKKVTLCKLILDKRHLEKLLSTYIDKLPECVLEKTHRLHCNFLQLGADTGRFSSKDPKLSANWGLKIRLTHGRYANMSFA